MPPESAWEETKNKANGKSAVDEYLERFYQLDFEDLIGDTPVRFQYTQVPANDYGMSLEEILLTDEKELNREVSLKRLAPYRDHEWINFKRQRSLTKKWKDERKAKERAEKKERKRTAVQEGSAKRQKQEEPEQTKMSKSEKRNHLRAMKRKHRREENANTHVDTLEE